MVFGVTSRLLTEKGIFRFFTSCPLYVIISSTSDVLSCVAFLTLLVNTLTIHHPPCYTVFRLSSCLTLISSRSSLRKALAAADSVMHEPQLKAKQRAAQLSSQEFCSTSNNELMWTWLVPPALEKNKSLLINRHIQRDTAH